MAALSPPPRISPHNPAVNTLAGAAGGIVSVLLGQPFDLIKVRLQTQKTGNAVRTTCHIFRNEGPLAFYKGALLPFIGVGAAVSIQFSVFHGAKSAFQKLRAKSSGFPASQLSNLDLYFAGGVAGIANSVISGPVEHVRIRLQMQPSGAARLYAGPLDCMKKIIQSAGWKGLFKAQHVSVLREFQAYGLYFYTFETCMNMMGKMKMKNREDLSTWFVAPCGALAGVAFWVGSYPLDVIKTKLQNDGFGEQRRYKSVWAVTAQTWQSGKFMGFFRGLGPTLIRTMLSSAGTFAMVEYVRRMLT